MVCRVGKRRLVTLSQGVGEYLVFNGITYRLLIGRDNIPLVGPDGQYLFGRA